MAEESSENLGREEAKRLLDTRVLLDEIAENLKRKFGETEPPQDSDPEGEHSKEYKRYADLKREWLDRARAYDERQRASADAGSMAAEADAETIDDHEPDDDTGLNGDEPVATLTGASNPNAGRQSPPPPGDDDAAREREAERRRRNLGAEAEQPRQEGRQRTGTAPGQTPPPSPPSGTVVDHTQENDFSEQVMSRRRGVVCTDKEIRLYKPVNKLTPADLDHMLNHIMKMGWVELYASNKAGGPHPALRQVLNAHMHSKLDTKKARSGTDKAFRSYCAKCNSEHGCMCHVSHNNTPPEFLPLHVRKKMAAGGGLRGRAQPQAEAPQGDRPAAGPDPRSQFADASQNNGHQDRTAGAGRNDGAAGPGAENNHTGGGGWRAWWRRAAGGGSTMGDAGQQRDQSFGTGEAGGWNRQEKPSAGPGRGRDSAQAEADASGNSPHFEFRRAADGSFGMHGQDQGQGPRDDTAASGAQRGGKTGRGGLPPPGATPA